MVQERPKFRFVDLEIWQDSIEVGDIFLVLEKRGLLGADVVTEMLDRLDHLCRKVTNFQKKPANLKPYAFDFTSYAMRLALCCSLARRGLLGLLPGLDDLC